MVVCKNEIPLQTKWWMICGIGYAFLSFVFLSISGCWTQWIFVNNTWKLVSMRDFQAFNLKFSRVRDTKLIIFFIFQVVSSIQGCIVFQNFPLFYFVHSFSAVSPEWIFLSILDDSQAVVHRIPTLACTSCHPLEYPNALLAQNMYES